MAYMPEKWVIIRRPNHGGISTSAHGLCFAINTARSPVSIDAYAPGLMDGQPVLTAEDLVGIAWPDYYWDDGFDLLAPWLKTCASLVATERGPIVELWPLLEPLIADARARHEASRQEQEEREAAADDAGTAQGGG